MKRRRQKRRSASSRRITACRFASSDWPVVASEDNTWIGSASLSLHEPRSASASGTSTRLSYAIVQKLAVLFHRSPTEFRTEMFATKRDRRKKHKATFSFGSSSGASANLPSNMEANLPELFAILRMKQQALGDTEANGCMTGWSAHEHSLKGELPMLPARMPSTPYSDWSSPDSTSVLDSVDQIPEPLPLTDDDAADIVRPWQGGCGLEDFLDGHPGFKHKDEDLLSFIYYVDPDDDDEGDDDCYYTSPAADLCNGLSTLAVGSKNAAGYQSDSPVDSDSGAQSVRTSSPCSTSYLSAIEGENEEEDDEKGKKPGCKDDSTQTPLPPHRQSLGTQAVQPTHNAESQTEGSELDQITELELQLRKRDAKIFELQERLACIQEEHVRKMQKLHLRYETLQNESLGPTMQHEVNQKSRSSSNSEEKVQVGEEEEEEKENEEPEEAAPEIGQAEDEREQDRPQQQPAPMLPRRSPPACIELEEELHALSIEPRTKEAPSVDHKVKRPDFLDGHPGFKRKDEDLLSFIYYVDPDDDDEGDDDCYYTSPAADLCNGLSTLAVGAKSLGTQAVQPTHNAESQTEGSELDQITELELQLRKRDAKIFELQERLACIQEEHVRKMQELHLRYETLQNESLGPTMQHEVNQKSRSSSSSEEKVQVGEEEEEQKANEEPEEAAPEIGQAEDEREQDRRQQQPAPMLPRRSPPACIELEEELHALSIEPRPKQAPSVDHKVKRPDDSTQTPLLPYHQSLGTQVVQPTHNAESQTEGSELDQITELELQLRNRDAKIFELQEKLACIQEEHVRKMQKLHLRYETLQNESLGPTMQHEKSRSSSNSEEKVQVGEEEEEEKENEEPEEAAPEIGQAEDEREQDRPQQQPAPMLPRRSPPACIELEEELHALSIEPRPKQAPSVDHKVKRPGASHFRGRKSS
ncbi:hypothetical protein MRX96_029786 [Rhipicephalus microplus]